MTTRPAHVLWQEMNRNKYVCQECKFRSFNAAHYMRHLKSSKHFLLTEFARDCPTDLKILIASFLPVYKLFRLPGRIGRSALRLVWQRPYQFRFHPRVVLPLLTFGSLAYSPVANLPVPTADEEAPEERSVQTRSFWISL